MAFVGTYDLLDTDDFTNGGFSPNDSNTEMVTTSTTNGDITYDGRMRYNSTTTVTETYYKKELKYSILETFIKNNYDYIFFTFNVFYDNIDNNETASIEVDVNGTTFTASSFSSTSSGSDKVEKVIFLLPQQFISSIRNELSLDFIFRIKNNSGSTSIRNNDSIYFTRNVSFYAMNRIDINTISPTGDGDLSTSTTTNLTSGSRFDFYHNAIDINPNNSNQYAGYVEYDIPTSNFSSGNKQTVFFNAYNKQGKVTSDVKFTINDEVVKTIYAIPEPDHEFDFTNVDSDGYVTDSYSSNYRVQFYNSPTVSTTDGVILDGTNQYGRIQYNDDGWQNEMWEFGGSSYTIEVVCKWYSFQSWSRIIDFAESSSDGDDNVLIANSGENDDLYIAHKTGATTIVQHGAITNSLDTNVEYHIVLTVDEDNDKSSLYVNGTLINEVTSSSISNLGNKTRQRAWFGRSNWSNDDYLDGSIRSFRFWNNTALTANQVESLNANRHLDNIFPIYYTSASTISSSIPIRVDLTGNLGSSGKMQRSDDKIYIDRMINIAPTAANVFDSGVEVNNTMNVTGNIFNSNLIGEIAMFYQDSSVPPFGYLWCDGTEISTDDDEKYRTLIEILSDDDRGSTSVGTTISCYLPDYMEDSTGCHLLQTETQQAPSNAPLYTNFNYNYKQNPAPSNTIVGNYSLDSDYFPSHNHTISNNISPSATITHNFAHEELNIQANNMYRFQDIEPADVGNDGGDSSDEKASWKSHYHNAIQTQKIWIEEPATPYEPDHTPTTIAVPQHSKYSVNITKTVNESFNADISLGYNGSAPTTSTTHIPLSFKVKYAIKYL